MYKNPFFLSPSAGIPDISGWQVLDAMYVMGDNTGNMLFARALQSVLGPSDRPAVAGFAKDLRNASDEHDCVVVAAANWLQPGTDLGEMCSAIEASGLPCLVVGIGAQAGTAKQFPSLQDGTRRFLSVVSERSNTISVRGEFTARTLEHYGIRNVEVTGCPSLLMMNRLPPKIIKRSTPPRRISICGSRGLPNEAVLKSTSATHRLSRLFAQLLQTDDVEFVAQAELPEIAIILEGICRDEPLREDWLNFAERYYDLPFEQLAPLLRDRMRVFFDLPQWLDYLRERDFVIGTRLHGVVAGLLAGTPSVLIVHDSRTNEMAEKMAFPTIPAGRIRDRIPYAEIYDEIDFEQFNLGYMAYYRQFRDFFGYNGICHGLDPDA